MSKHIAITRHADILQIKIDRPEKRNSLTGAMYDAMTATINAADAAGDVAAIVIIGSNGVFCAGNDIADFIHAEHGLQGSPALTFIRTIANCTTPLIAAIDGLAIGIGTTLILHCDLVYATPSSSFRMPFVDLALVPEAAASLIVPHRVGLAKATELLMLGDPFDGTEAHRLGLVNALIEADHLTAHAMRQAARLAAKPRAALMATRRLIRGDTSTVLARIDAEAKVFGAQMASPEARAIFQSFLAKSKVSS